MAGGYTVSRPSNLIPPVNILDGTYKNAINVLAGIIKFGSGFPDMDFPTTGGASVLRLYNYTSELAYGSHVFRANGTANFIAGANLGVGTTAPTPTARLHVQAGSSTTAPIKLDSGAVNTAPENGSIEYDGTNFFCVPDGSIRRNIRTSRDTTRTTALFTKGLATLSNITGLTADVVAGNTYEFCAELFYDCQVASGSQYSVAGTCTATAIIASIIETDDTTDQIIKSDRITALGAASNSIVGQQRGKCIIKGVITVNASGTLVPQFGLSAGGLGHIAIGSTWKVSEIQ